MVYTDHGQNTAAPFTNLSKTVFTLECFTVDF